MLDAHGHNRAEIARELEISPATVARLRRDPDYQALVAKYAESTSSALKPILEQMSGDVIKGVQAGIKTLIALCEAEDSDGNPLYGVRKDAAAELVSKGLQFLQPHTAPAASGGSTQQLAPSITFHINSETGKVSAGPVPVDAEAEEDDGE